MGEENKVFETDFLIIGTGAAGLRAAIEARRANVNTIILSRRAEKDAHTTLAAGGINAVLGNVDPEDSWEQHFADTLIESYFLSNPRMVEILAKEAPQAILELAEWGCNFAITPEGKIDQRFFGAHKYRRTCYAGDYTGREVLRTLHKKALEVGVEIHDHTYVTKLLVHNKMCLGAYAFDISSGERRAYLAGAVLLAGGGYTRLWQRSSSRQDENLGEGLWLALDAGATLADMELVQFHPTGMVTPEEKAGTLVTEAVRGEGGILRNTEGERFMRRYDPERMELSTRDRVALAVYTEIMEGRGGPNGGVFLDVSHLTEEKIEEKLPRMKEQFEQILDLDISQEPMEVAPTAHYSMGGVVVDAETGTTEITGLYAAGEVTSGLHGANRLGGNSLAETLVFGRLAGESAAAFANSSSSQIGPVETIEAAQNELNELLRDGVVPAIPFQERLRRLLWENCGVVREQNRLHQGLDGLREIDPFVRQKGDIREPVDYRGAARLLDLRAGLDIAEAVFRSALARKESRGAHQRTDYPQVDPDFELNFVILNDDREGLILAEKKVPPIPGSLREWIDKTGEHDLKGRLLE
jgi:succinate dehydrogenase / fumarate reductase, flavoprotein subunit